MSYASEGKAKTFNAKYGTCIIENVIQFVVSLPACYLALYVDDNDNKMTFHLRPLRFALGQQITLHGRK